MICIFTVNFQENMGKTNQTKSCINYLQKILYPPRSELAGIIYEPWRMGLKFLSNQGNILISECISGETRESNQQRFKDTILIYPLKLKG